MAIRFKKLTVTRVDAVDKGANYDRKTGDGSHIMIYKAAGASSKPGDPDVTSDEGKPPQTVIQKFLSRITQFAKEYEPPTFDEALLARRMDDIMCDIYERVDALNSVLYGVAYNTPNPKEAMQAALDDFAASCKAALEEWFKETTDTQKRAPDAWSDERRAKIEKARDNMTALLERVMIAKAADDPETKTMSEKTQTTNSPQEIDIAKMVTEAVAKAIEPIKAENETLKAQLEVAKKATDDAAATAKAEKDARELSEQTIELKKFAHLPVDVSKDAPIFKALKEKAPEEFKRVAELLNAADEQLKLAKALGAISGEGFVDHSGTAYEKIQAAAKVLVEKGEAKTIQQGIALVSKRSPELAEEYRKEQLARAKAQ
jgi:hypothetical protein